MLYDSTIKETRYTIQESKTNQHDETECSDCAKEIKTMWDRLYIIAYLLKTKFRHPAAKVSC